MKIFLNGLPLPFDDDPVRLQKSGISMGPVAFVIASFVMSALFSTCGLYIQQKLSPAPHKIQVKQ